MGVDLEQLEAKETSARALFALCRAVGPAIVAPHVPQLLPAAVNLLSNLFSDALPLLAAALVPDLVANACLMSQGGNNGNNLPVEWVQAAGEEALQACLSAAWAARGAIDRSAAAHATAFTASSTARAGSTGGGVEGPSPNTLWRPSLIKVRLLSICLDSAADVLQALSSCHSGSSASSGIRSTTGVRSEVASACLELLWSEVQRILVRRQERQEHRGSFGVNVSASHAVAKSGHEDDEDDEAAAEEDEWEEDRMASIVRATAAVLSAPGVLPSPQGYWWQFVLPHLANILQSSQSGAVSSHNGDDDVVLQALALDALSGALMAVFEAQNGDQHACGAWADVLGLLVGASLRVLNAGLSPGQESSGREDDSSGSGMEQRWIAAVSALAMALAVLPSPANPKGRSADDVASFAGLDDLQLLQNVLRSIWLPLNTLLAVSAHKHDSSSRYGGSAAAEEDDLEQESDDEDEGGEDTSCGEAAAAAVVLLLCSSSRGAAVAPSISELAAHGSSDNSRSSNSEIIHALLPKLPLAAAPTSLAKRAHGALVGAFVRNDVGINLNGISCDFSSSLTSQHQLAAWLIGLGKLRVAHKAALETARGDGPLAMLTVKGNSGGERLNYEVFNYDLDNGESTVLDAEMATALGHGGAVRRLIASLPAGLLDSFMHRGLVSVEHAQALIN